MAKTKKPRNKKHVPHKRAQRNLEEIRATTWFAGGHWQDAMGSITGNFDYEINSKTALAIQRMKNQWSYMLVCYLDTHSGIVAKCQEGHINQHSDRSTVEKTIQAAIDRFAQNQDKNSFLSISWFMIPQPSLNMIAIKDTILDIL